MTESGPARASAAKTAQASERNRGLAVKAIELADTTQGIEARWLLVARAVVEHEGASWQQIGDACGMSKFQAASCFRRLLVATGLRRG